MIADCRRDGDGLSVLGPAAGRRGKEHNASAAGPRLIGGGEFRVWGRPNTSINPRVESGERVASLSNQRQTGCADAMPGRRARVRSRAGKSCDTRGLRPSVRRRDRRGGQIYRLGLSRCGGMIRRRLRGGSGALGRRGKARIT